VLSRVADALYWTGRYLERAAHGSRILHVTSHRLLDAQVDDPQGAWEEVLRSLGARALFEEHFEALDAAGVTQFVLRHPENPNAVEACIVRARENARSARDQISSDMWEHLNSLSLHIRGAGLRHQHDLFLRVQRASHAFLGATEATMSRGEGYEFLQLGTHLERADGTVRTLAAQQALTGDGEPAWSDLVALLKSCNAFEPFGKAHPEIAAGSVVESLLLDRALPHSALHCLFRCRDAANQIGGSDRPGRALGHLCADLEYAELPEASALPAFLKQLGVRIDGAAATVVAAYFETSALVTAPYAMSAEQQ
jgi:uncharacterized alpha-E superfamily protein